MAFDIRRLAQPAVRDLAWVLCAPQVLRAAPSPPAPFPLWTGLDNGELLARNTSLLLALDAQPAPLHAFLRARNRTRLGDRFEALVQYALGVASLPDRRILGLRASLPLHDVQQLRGDTGGPPSRQAPLAAPAPAPQQSPPPVSAPGQGGAFQWWNDRRAAGEARRAAKRAAFVARKKAPAFVTVGECDFLFGEEAAAEPREDGHAAAPPPAPVLRHLEVSVKFLLYSETLAAAKACGRVAAHIPVGTGLRCLHAGCAVGEGAAAAAAATGVNTGAPAPPLHAACAQQPLLLLPPPPLAAGAAPTGQTNEEHAAPGGGGGCLAAWAHRLGCYHGPHRLESLELKLRRGRGQLALTAHPRAQEWLAQHAAALLQPPLPPPPPPDGGASALAAAPAQAEGPVVGRVEEDQADGGGVEAAPAPPAPAPPVASTVPVSAAYLLKGYLFYALHEFVWLDREEAGNGDELPALSTAASAVLAPALLARLPPAIPRDHLAGWFTASVAELTARRPRSRWVVLPKPFWLGPLVIPCSAADVRAMEAAWAAASRVPPPPTSVAPAAAAAGDDGRHATGGGGTRARPPAAAAKPFPDGFDQCSSAAEKARWRERQTAARTAALAPAAEFVKYAGVGSGFFHWDGLGPNARSRVMDGRALAAAVASNHDAAVATATARALRLLVAELQYHAGWRPHVGGGCCEGPGAWVEVSRGFLVEPGWDDEGDAAHEAKFGPEMAPVGARGPPPPPASGAGGSRATGAGRE